MAAITRKALLSSGTPRREIDAALRRGDLVMVHPGYYATDGSWRSMMEAHLLRGGPSSMVSHRAAAHLCGFDGFKVPSSHDLVVPHDSAFRCRPAVRSRNLADRDVVVHHGMRVTSVVRTLLDLASVLDADRLEIALESALRGSDRRRPDRWRTDLHDALVERLRDDRHRPGTSKLRAVLARRPPGCRPTGSYAETVTLQGLRTVGLGDVWRQPTVVLDDGRLGISGRWYPDFVDPRSGVAGEVDGEAGHAPLAARRRDAHRDNILGGVLRVLRTTATDAQADPSGFARMFSAEVGRRSAGLWHPHGFDVVITDQCLTFRR